MNDSSGKTNSCLAITEKKTTHRPGGCIGIFFQLFDWNRRLAKKKLFSKKLLPPARTKQHSKKFKGDEKMTNSKHHLIANENSGGFPSSKKGGNHGVDVEKKHEMRVPGLVARLMGLESIPASQRDKPKKASFSDSCGDGEKDSSANNHCELDREGLNSEMRVAKHDSRPQKLQKTEIHDSRAVTRFGAEALQIKNVLSRSKKHHHPKFVPPLKSPRITAGKNASRSSRLIGAATKILEPGLQANSRAKCFITYSESKYYPKNDFVAEVVGNKLTDLEKQSDYDAGAVTSLMGLTSCKNCGNVLDVVDCRPDVNGQPAVSPIVSEVATVSSMESAQRKGSSFAGSHEQACDIVLLRSREPHISLIPEERGKSHDTQSCNEPTTRRVPLPNEHQAPWNSTSHLCRTLEDNASSISVKLKSQIQEHMLGSHRLAPGSRMSNQHIKKLSSDANTANGAKDFVALNRSLSGQTRLRSPNKVDNSKFDLEKKPCNRQEDSLSRVRTLERKRRTPNVTPFETTAYVHSTMGKQRDIRYDAVAGKRRDINASPINSSNRSKRGAQGKTDKVVDKKVNDVVSFTFNSPLKHKTGIPSEKEELSCGNEIKTPCQKTLPLTGDALGAFLEQKLKELTSHEDDELATGAPPKKSTAMILQELISALSAEHLTCHNDHMVNADIGFQNGAKKGRLLGSSYDGNHLSPGSVLEASFSSSSLDESSGHNLHSDSMSCSYDQPEQLEPEAELLDSAASFNKGKIGSEALIDLVSQIPTVLESLNYFGLTLTRSKVSHVKDVILNAELLLGNATIHGEDRVPHLFIAHFLADELDNMADDIMGTEFDGFVGCEDFKARSQLKGFLFDCAIEYLESNCCRYCSCGFKTWARLPLCMKERLVHEVKRDIKKWACLAGMMPDEIIEWEMSHSLGKWTDFDIEAFEAGVEIDGDILQILVDEIIEDLADCRCVRCFRFPVSAN